MSRPSASVGIFGDSPARKQSQFPASLSSLPVL